MTLRSSDGAGFGFDIYGDNSGAIAVQSLQAGGPAQQSGLMHPGQSVSFHTSLQTAPTKNHPLGKILYLRKCERFFHQIFSACSGGVKPDILRVSLDYFLAFKNYNY